MAVTAAKTCSRPPLPGGPAAASQEAAERVWSRWAFAGILLLGTALRVWQLDISGYGNPYFSAGVRSMMQSWHNFFFNAFDPAGFVSLDKPPVAFWIQVASAKVLGFGGLSVLLPQVLEGIATIAVVYALVQRRFGAPAALFAAAALAVTPISVTMDRSSGTDTCLVLVLTLAAWPLLRAAETGRLRLLLLAMVLVGIAFNVKMVEAFGVLPAFMAVYFMGAPIGWRQRLGHLGLAAVVLGAVSLSWSVAYDLVPADSRPFVGSSTGNSMLELAAVYNGLDRFIPRARAFPAAFPGRPGIRPPGGAGPGAVRQPGAGPAAGSRFFMGASPPGPLRLADWRLAAQVGWLAPVAVLGVLAGRPGRLTWPRVPTQLSLALWGGWALTYGVVYSVARILHPSYLLPMAPPLAALAGIGAVRLWSCYCSGRGLRRFLLPVALLVTAAWQAYLELGSAGAGPMRPPGASALPLSQAVPTSWPFILLACGTPVVAAGVLLAVRHGLRHFSGRGIAAASVPLALGALLVAPTSWTVRAAERRGGAVPWAGAPGPARDLNIWSAQLGGRAGALRADRKLVAFLEAHHQGEKYLLATLNARQAAPIIIETGEAVIAMGGFTGADPILDPGRLARMVESKQLRFVMVGGNNAFGQRPGGAGRQGLLIDWVRRNGKVVDPALWRPSLPSGDPGNPDVRPVPQRLSPMQLYDLRPPDGAAPAR